MMNYKGAGLTTVRPIRQRAANDDCGAAFAVTAEAEDRAFARQTRLSRVFLVNDEGVAVGVLMVETVWSDVERPSLRIAAMAVPPARRSRTIEGRLVDGAAMAHVEFV